MWVTRVVFAVESILKSDISSKKMKEVQRSKVLDISRDIIFLNLHRKYLDYIPTYGGFLGIYILSASTHPPIQRDFYNAALWVVEREQPMSQKTA